MNRSTFFVISLYFSVLTSTYTATILTDGTIIEIGTDEQKTVNRINVNERLNPFIDRRVQNGRRQYQTVVNGNPVTIEVIREDQLNRPGQIEQNPNYWQQMQKRFPIKPNKPNQGSFIITKENSPYPNIEIYDVYTDAGTNSNTYPMFPNQNINKYANNLPYPNPNTYNNRYSKRPPMHFNGNWVPPYNSNQYPNGNPYHNQNEHNGNLNHNMDRFPDDINTDGEKNINLSEVNKDGEKNINLSEINKNQHNQSQQNHNSNNRDDTTTGQSHEDNRNNVAGYIDKFPIILLNENEIRR